MLPEMTRVSARDLSSTICRYMNQVVAVWQTEEYGNRYVILGLHVAEPFQLNYNYCVW